MRNAKPAAKGTAVHVFVDNTNVFIEGKRASAIRLGMKASTLDGEFVIDYGKLLYTVQDARHLAGIPKMYGSVPPPNDSVWQRIRDDGYDLKLFKRNIFGREKGVDVELALAAQELVFDTKSKGLRPGTICIVAGDADYVPLAERLRQAGWVVEVWYWNNAADALKKAANRFESLNKHIDFVGTRPKRKPVKRARK
jgi:uncharacterized LabA/DUF88 family protein